MSSAMTTDQIEDYLNNSSRILKAIREVLENECKVGRDDPRWINVALKVDAVEHAQPLVTVYGVAQWAQQLPIKPIPTEADMIKARFDDIEVVQEAVAAYQVGITPQEWEEIENGKEYVTRGTIKFWISVT